MGTVKAKLSESREVPALSEETSPKGRLEYLRGELRAERISMGELIELQSLVKFIEAEDVELLEAAGVPEREDPWLMTL